MTYALLNWGITLGYLFIGVAIMPHIDMKRKWVAWAGVAFFLTCGFTHFSMGYHALMHGHHAFQWYDYANHAVQVVAVWFFVIGLYLEFVSDHKEPT